MTKKYNSLEEEITDKFAEWKFNTTLQTYALVDNFVCHEPNKIDMLKLIDLRNMCKSFLLLGLIKSNAKIINGFDSLIKPYLHTAITEQQYSMNNEVKVALYRLLDVHDSYLKIVTPKDIANCVIKIRYLQKNFSNLLLYEYI